MSKRPTLITRASVPVLREAWHALDTTMSAALIVTAERPLSSHAAAITSAWLQALIAARAEIEQQLDRLGDGDFLDRQRN